MENNGQPSRAVKRLKNKKLLHLSSDEAQRRRTRTDHQESEWHQSLVTAFNHVADILPGNPQSEHKNGSKQYILETAFMRIKYLEDRLRDRDMRIQHLEQMLRHRVMRVQNLEQMSGHSDINLNFVAKPLLPTAVSQGPNCTVPKPAVCHRPLPIAGNSQGYDCTVPEPSVSQEYYSTVPGPNISQGYDRTVLGPIISQGCDSTVADPSDSQRYDSTVPNPIVSQRYNYTIPGSSVSQEFDCTSQTPVVDQGYDCTNERNSLYDNVDLELAGTLTDSLI